MPAIIAYPTAPARWYLGADHTYSRKAEALRQHEQGNPNENEPLRKPTQAAPPSYLCEISRRLFSVTIGDGYERYTAPGHGIGRGNLTASTVVENASKKYTGIDHNNLTAGAAVANALNK